MDLDRDRMDPIFSCLTRTPGAILSSDLEMLRPSTSSSSLAQESIPGPGSSLQKSGAVEHSIQVQAEAGILSSEGGEKMLQNPDGTFGRYF